MMRILYCIYQLFIAVPLFIVWTIIISLTVVVGCSLGGGHWFGYYPGKAWGWLSLKLFLLPVKVEGRENLKEGESYVFVSNHQSMFDIFLIFGHLGRQFKWMMKHQLRKMPFIGFACARSHQIFVDKRGPSKIKKTYDEARKILQGGMSLSVFPEGARTFTGHMGVFKKGAFALADELQLPVVPLTINGSFNVMPRTKDWHFATWHPLKLTIHQPIYPVGQDFPKKPAKVMLHNTNLMHAIYPIEIKRQDIMETFFVNSMWKDHTVNLGGKDGYYIVDGDKRFRICNAEGSNKIRINPDTIYARYNTEVGMKNQIPLWLLGFLY